MSETRQIPLTKIVAPTLTDVKYANNLDTAFENINDNFIKLANHDFVKGESGASVEIRDTEKIVNDNGTLTILGQKLKACIDAASTINERENIKDNNGNTITYIDNLINNPGKLYMIYNVINENEEPVAISSLYYVFLDARYANVKIGTFDEDQYTGIKDLSCIVIYDANATCEIDGKIVYGAFKILSNAFPTIYYEKGIGLCWKVNGNPTGIPVQGIPGKDGLNASLQIVKCKSVDETKVNKTNNIIRGEVTHIYNMNDGYVSIETVDIDTIRAQYDNQATLILVTEVDKGFYFGYLRVVDDKLYAYCDQESAINYGIETEAIINAMKKINLLNNGDDVSSGAKGLFIPMQPVNKDGVQPVHLFSAASITNTEGQESDIKADVIVTPVADINNLNVVGSETEGVVNGEGNLHIEKYLYLKLMADEKSDLGIFTADNKTETGLYYENCKLHGFVLKYKLTNIVKDYDRPWFSTINDNSAGARVLGAINHNGTTIDLNDSNVIYYSERVINNHKLGEVAGRYTDNHIETMPTQFSDRLSKSDDTDDNVLGIYRWELCSTPHPFDVDELLKYQVENPNIKYNFPTPFNVIFTTTINPGINTDYMWFNGLQTIDAEWFGIDDNDTNVDDYGFTNTGAGTDYSGKYVLPGWSYGSNESIFKFIKFVPIYDNDFDVKTDTALNINYNVNITGNDNNSTRNITVNGNINCDNLNVYRLSATGEIKDIYTKDLITGESGIALAYDESSDNKFKFTVDGSGNVVVDGTISTPNIYCSSQINTDELIARQIYSDDFKIKNSYGKDRLFIGIRKDVNGNPDNTTAEQGSIDFESNNTYKIDIKRATPNKSTTLIGYKPQLHKPVGYSPVIINDMPTIMHNKSNIIVSNQTNNSIHLCYDHTYANVVEYKFNIINPNSPFESIDPSVITPGIGSIGSGNISVIQPSGNSLIQSPGSGVFTDAGIENIDKDGTIICDASRFDVVKNFNMHRLSLTGAALVSNEAVNIYYDYSEIANDSQPTIEKNKLAYYGKIDGDKEKNYTLGKQDMTEAEILAYANTQINGDGTGSGGNKYLHKFSVNQLNMPISGNVSYTFNRNKNFEITFNNDYVFKIGVKGENKNGRWPVLWDTSRMYIDIFYDIEGDYGIKKLYTKEYNYDWTASTLKNDKANGHEWRGYSDEGINLSNNGDVVWRYYTFKFRPLNIVLASNTYKSQFTEIADAYDHGYNVNIYIIPRFYLYVRGQYLSGIQKKCVRGISISNIVPIDTVSTASTTIKNIDVGKKTATATYKVDTSIKPVFISYSANKYDTTYDSIDGNNVNSTTLCEDGIVMRAGKYTFGLGYTNAAVNHESVGYEHIDDVEDPTWKITTRDNQYHSKIPILFYHKSDEKYYKTTETGVITPKSGGTSKLGYARRMNAVTLPELFEVVKWMRSVKADDRFIYGV